MEQFASNFPISNNILAANVGMVVRPTHNTDKSLSGGRERGVRVGGEWGRVGERRSIRTDHSWLPDESSLQMRLPQSIKRAFVGLERAGVCSAGLVRHRMAGQGPGWLTVSQAYHEVAEAESYGIQPPTEAADLGRLP